MCTITSPPLREAARRSIIRDFAQEAQKAVDIGRTKSEYKEVFLFGDSARRLVGIERLAQQSPLLAAKQKVEYFELPARSVLNRCSSPRMPFAWTINPYRGCEFGCKYCYARYTHEFMGMHEGREFEQKIYSKSRAAEILAQELKRHREGSIAIGTSTDPYQPAEQRWRTTRSILEIFAREKGRTLSITTKSNLILRDLDLLERIRRRNVLHVNITITTVDAELARKLEPKAPRPDLRLKAVAGLAAQGISTGVFANPVMPLITDSWENLDAVASAAVRAGAGYFGGGTLFLMPSAQREFFPFLQREFPRLSRRYRERYQNNPYLRGQYALLIQQRVEQVRCKRGLPAAPQPYQPEEWPWEASFGAASQLSLFDEAPPESREAASAKNHHSAVLSDVASSASSQAR